MEVTLRTLAAVIKERERARYVRWIQHLWLDSISWSTRCALVDLIRQDHATALSPPLFDGSSSRFAGDLDDLVAAHIASIYAPEFCGEHAWNGVS